MAVLLNFPCLILCREHCWAKRAIMMDNLTSVVESHSDYKNDEKYLEVAAPQDTPSYSAVSTFRLAVTSVLKRGIGYQSRRTSRGISAGVICFLLTQAISDQTRIKHTASKRL